jgi:hypothetical protein
VPRNTKAGAISFGCAGRFIGVSAPNLVTLSADLSAGLCPDRSRSNRVHADAAVFGSLLSATIRLSAEFLRGFDFNERDRRPYAPARKIVLSSLRPSLRSMSFHMFGKRTGLIFKMNRRMRNKKTACLLVSAI